MSRRRRKSQEHDSRRDANAGEEPADSPNLPNDAAAGGETPGEDKLDSPATGPADQGDEEAPYAEPAVKAQGWEDAPVKVRQRPFPSPGPKDERLRIAMSAEATAEVSAHAKASLDEEVCGVLLGEVCEDAHGLWVSAKAAVRGTSAKRGGQHVTYTHETWEKIHEVKDRKFPKLNIVGWYHSHPGFGVEFSDMDKFIQQNFFSGPTQFALVVDPLGGDEAVCVCGDGDVHYISRYWIDGRERTCRVPQDESNAAAAAGGAVPAGVDKRLRSVEEKLQQLLQAREDDRASRHGFRLILGMLVAVGLISWIGLGLMDRLFRLPQPPQSLQMTNVPIEVEGKPAMLGIQLKSWDIPPEWQAEFLKQQQSQFEELLLEHEKSLRNLYDDELKRNIREIQRQLEAKLAEATKREEAAAKKRAESAREKDTEEETSAGKDNQES